MGSYPYGRCRCMEPLRPDRTCRHGCLPPGAQPKRRQSIGHKPDDSAAGDIRNQVHAACKRLGLQDRWGTYSERRLAQLKSAKGSR